VRLTCGLRAGDSPMTNSPAVLVRTYAGQGQGHRSDKPKKGTEASVRSPAAGRGPKAIHEGRTIGPLTRMGASPVLTA
jgi:hypothetical protein